MATAALFIGWGQVARGREQQSLKVFGEAIQYYTELQQRGEIESFEPVALEQHGGDLAGFLLIRGEQDQLARIRSSPEFLRLNSRATLVVDNLGVVTAYVGEAVNQLFAQFQAQFADLT
jgi:hypothetical protein